MTTPRTIKVLSLKLLLRAIGCMYLTTNPDSKGIVFFAWTFLIAEALNVFAGLIEIYNPEKLEE